MRIRVPEMKKISEYLIEKYGKWGWLGQRAHDACGINRILPLDLIICCDHGRELPVYFRPEDVYSVEGGTGIRRDWSNEDLNDSLKGDLGRRIRRRLVTQGGKVNLICYRSVRRLENGKGRYRNNPRLLAVAQRIKKRFDNKALLHRSLPGLSLPQIPGIVDRISRADFKRLREDLELPFVIQFPYGSSGHYTFLIKRPKDLKSLVEHHPEATALIRKYIDGFSLNVNAVVLSSGNGPRVMCSAPSVQMTGIPECSNSPASFCGNDYSAARDLDPALVRQVKSYMETIGRWMASSGFRGLFGMDFVVKDGTAYPVEINPRFQNSTSLLTVLHSLSANRKGTLFLLHIAEFLQDKDVLLRRYIKDFPAEELMRPVEGSQLIIHNRLEKRLVTGDLFPGVYRRQRKGLKHLKQGASLWDCSGPDEFLLTSGVPAPSLRVEPNAPVLKIQSRGNLLDISNKRRLTPETAKIVSLVYERLSLKKPGRVKTAEPA
ncbi:MAG: ATP-grasp domain-containing protein [Candidatus Omnitrophica bacterium]|nr:ATP-grasp domain-containing protein [Candidatus Omnitrophota bacterium]